MFYICKMLCCYKCMIHLYTTKQAFFLTEKNRSFPLRLPNKNYCLDVHSPIRMEFYKFFNQNEGVSIHFFRSDISKSPQKTLFGYKKKFFIAFSKGNNCLLTHPIIYILDIYTPPTPPPFYLLKNKLIFILEKIFSI